MAAVEHAVGSYHRRKRRGLGMEARDPPKSGKILFGAIIM